VRVDIGTLQSMAGQCRGEAADTTARHAHLSSSINASVLDGWTDSQAAVRFTELYEQWRQSAQGVSEALNGMGSLLSGVAASYQQHEADMAARIGGLLH
jgi:WXG100 family type VII secretion target